MVLHFAEHFDITAKRNCAKFPASTNLVRPAEEFAPETDRENLNPNAALACSEVVPHLMHENEHGQHHQKGDHVIPDHC